MNIRGSAPSTPPRDAVFAAICDPDVLLGVIPGCREIEQVGDAEYRGGSPCGCRVSSGRTGPSSAWSMPTHPRYGRLEGEVEGALGSIKGRATFRLTEADGRTTVDYEGQAVIGGPLARLDARFVEGLAGSLSARACGNLEAAAAARPRQPRRPTGRAATEGDSGVTVRSYFLPRSLPEALGLLEATALRCW